MENTHIKSDVPISHESVIEQRHPEFYKVCQSVVSLYGDIPDQRTSLIGIEDTYKIVFPEDKKLSQWHYWKALREEFETLESSIFLGNMYDNNLYELLANIINKSIPYNTYSQKIILPYKEQNKKNKYARCSVCEEKDFVIKDQECRNCGAGPEDQENYSSSDESDSDSENIELNLEQAAYIKKWNFDHPNDQIVFKTKGKKPEQKDPKKILGELIVRFCATYPTISYVLLKAGLHYPLAILGDHPVLVGEVCDLQDEKKGKAVKSKGKAGKKSTIKPRRTIHNIQLPRRDEDYESYAHQWVSLSSNYSTIRTLLDKTSVVPRILICDASHKSNVPLLKELYKKNYADHKSLMIKTIFSMKIEELMCNFESGTEDNLALAILYCNYNLIEKILSVPEMLKIIKKENTNITGMLSRTFDVCEDEDIEKTIKVLSKYIQIQRFCNEYTENLEDKNENLEDKNENSEDENSGNENSEEEIKEDILQRALKFCSFSVITALMKIPSMDIVTFIKYGGKYSPVIDIIKKFPATDGLKDIIDMYIADPVNLLKEALRLDLEEVSSFLINNYVYSMEQLIDVMAKSDCPSDIVYEPIWRKMKELRGVPDDLSEPIIFERKE